MNQIIKFKKLKFKNNTIIIIISMDILLEALNKYKEIIEAKGECIHINTSISEEDKDVLLIPIFTSYEKIEAFIDEIKTTIEMGINNLTVKKCNSYIKNHKLNNDDIVEIKIIMRRIKNRFYKKESREKLTASNVLYNIAS